MLSGKYECVGVWLKFGSCWRMGDIYGLVIDVGQYGLQTDV